MEKIIYNYLKKFKVKFITEATHKTLVNPKTDKNLFFDFYLPELKLIIEYDGIDYHINEDVIERDKFKEQWARNNNIKVIRLNRRHVIKLELKKILDQNNIKRKKPIKIKNIDSQPKLSIREKYRLSKELSEYKSSIPEPEYDPDKNKKWKLKHKSKGKKLSPFGN